MDNSLPIHFAFNYKDLLIDEIALDGLEGIGIDLLWRRVEKRVSSPVTPKMQLRLWKFIINSSSISFYQLPEAPERIEIKDRFETIDEESGFILDPPDYLDGPYEYKSVPDEYGSCVNYETRIKISREDLQSLTYEELIQKYGDTLVMVASIEERWRALVPHMPISYLAQLTPAHYCILELVGRARENGQMTVGKTNLTKIVKDSKLLFYNRNFLQNLGIVRAQTINQLYLGRSYKSILLRLKRFYRPASQTLPKVGKIHNAIQFLLKQPDHTSTVDNLLKFGFTRDKLKRLRKINDFLDFERKHNLVNKNKKALNPSITLNLPSDESSESEEETKELECQYKVHVNIMRQAYERFLDAGQKGLTQIELAQLLGIEFYTARTITRVLKSRKIIREFFEDRGKQRIGRYVSTVSASSEIDNKFEAERKKLLQYLDNSSIKSKHPSPEKDNTVLENEIPKKKPKVEPQEEVIDNIKVDPDVLESSITQVTHIEGFEDQDMSLLNSKKSLTLRQLKFANGIVKVIRKELVVESYHILSLLVSKEINDTPMATKSLKAFVQRLITDGQIKVLKVNWPGVPNKHSVLLCAPHVKNTDPVIKAKYKEINIRAIKFGRYKLKKAVPKIATKPIAVFLYPRYMKIKMLHEFIMKIVYFNEDNDNDARNSLLPRGFSSLMDIMPELTLDFLLGHMNNASFLELIKSKIPHDMFEKKLRNAPAKIFELFLVSEPLNGTLKQNLKALAMFGLIQLIKNTTGNDENATNYEFYVNRHAKIIDTSGEWPRDNVDLQELEKNYYFESLQDVDSFWYDVQSTSLHTKITLESTERNGKPQPVPLRLRSEVQAQDNGQVFGNGLGPCGYDATFYMEIPRYWSVYYTQPLKKHQMLHKNTIIKLPKSCKRPRRPIKAKPVNVKRILNQKPIEKKLSYRQTLKIREAKGGGAAVTWSKEEDHIIMLCKAAITVMSPVGQLGCLMLRNMVARDILSICDPKKTASLCHKRAIILEPNTTLAYEKDCIISELKHRPHLLNTYEGLYKVFKQQYPCNTRKLMEAARPPMLELVWLMYMLVRNKSFNQKRDCVATSLEDFHNHYEISTSNVNKNYNAYKTPVTSDPQQATIKEGIIQTVMSSFRTKQSPDIANTIYTMFSSYSEQTLRPVIEQLRRSGAVSAKDKTLNVHIQKYDLQDIVQSSYKLSAAYQRQWVSRLNSDFVSNLVSILNEKLPRTGLKGKSEINCLMLELCCCDVLEMSPESVPVITGSTTPFQEEQLTATEMMSQYKLNLGTMSWKNKADFEKFTDLYQHIDYDEALNVLLANSEVKDPSETTDTDKEIISHLKAKKEAGSTLSELQEATGYDSETLTKKLSELESQNIVHRLGYYQNMIVLSEFKQPWTMNVGDKAVCPTPWLTLDVEIRNDVLLKWAGEVMNKVFEQPGCSVAYLSEACEYLATRSVQDICILLEKGECVKLKCMKVAEPDLFSDSDAIPELVDYSPYEAVENILVFPVPDSLVKFANMRKNLYHEYSESVDSS